jgi:hypothetical protein
MKSPPHSTLPAAYAERSLQASKPARRNWIAAVLEALYQMQRRQAIKVIRIYQGLLKPRSD